MMSDKNNLPLLPGFSYDKNLGKKYFGKKQCFTVMGKICTVNEMPKIINRPQSLYSSCLSSNLPLWLLYDKQILTFYGNFQDSSYSIDSLKIRPVKIIYYLEDGTMKVIEPKTDNSGLCQGTIVGRQRIPLPQNNGQYFEITDLNVGKEIEVFGKRFMIIDCDSFTRKFLNRLGVKVPEPLGLPALEKPPQIRASQMESKMSKKSLQFLQYDGMVLRFNGYWDDRQSEYGLLHHLEIFYYLSDDSMEIRETFPQHPKGENSAVFLRRAPLPKLAHQPQIAKYGPPFETYGPSDLAIGKPINVYGRLVMLTSCDCFTKEYYSTKYGIENIETIPLPDVPTHVDHTRRSGRYLPPWNGFGTHEDSAGNCDTIEPKAPYCDFYKFLNKDRYGPESHILRFTARLISNIPDYDMRRFILSYYLKDDTVSIFEVGVRNSGFQSGMFYKRNKVLLPEQNLFSSEFPTSYTVDDMWMGNVLTINKYRFLIVGADDYTLNYMEQHSEEFPKSNVVRIMDKIRNRLSSSENGFKEFVSENISNLHPTNKSFIPTQFLEKALKKAAGDLMTQQEFITIIRYFQKKEVEPSINKETIRSMVYTYICRHLWQNNAHLAKHFQYLDKSGSGYLSRKEVRQTLKANRLPIPDELLDQMLDVIQTNDEGYLNYDDAVDFLNYSLKPAQMIISHPAVSTKKIQKFSPADLLSEVNFTKQDLVNWDAFVDYLDLEHTVTSKS